MLDSFLPDNTNKRNDVYGDPIENCPR
nr:hypothetical protein [Methylomonas fluvii]